MLIVSYDPRAKMTPVLEGFEKPSPNRVKILNILSIQNQFQGNLIGFVEFFLRFQNFSFQVYLHQILLLFKVPDFQPSYLNQM